jgi:hypothetical protein
MFYAIPRGVGLTQGRASLHCSEQACVDLVD